MKQFLIDNKLFVHASIMPGIPLKDQSAHVLFWDRSFFSEAYGAHQSGHKTQLTKYDEVYIGHTPISRFGLTMPTLMAEVWMMDTGAGWGDLLSMMDIDSKEIFQSDVVAELTLQARAEVRVKRILYHQDFH